MSIPYTIHGPLAPVTMELYGISAAQQGLIVTTQAAGALGTAVFIALKGERYNKIHAIAFGLFIIGIMGAVIGSAPVYAVLLVIVVALGIGTVFIDVMMNGAISDVYPSRKKTLLPFVHGFFTVGGMLVPGMVALVASPDQPETFVRPFHVLFVVALTVGIFYFIGGRRVMPETPYINMDAMKKRVTENPAEVFKTKKAWLFITVGFLYHTCQVGVIMWFPTFAIQNTGVDFATGGLVLTLFFAGNLVMRFIGPLFLRVISPRKLYAIFGAISGALLIGAIFSESITVIFILITAAGFMQGSNVAAFMLICFEAFPERSASAASITSICVGLSNLTAPFWMGFMSEYTGGFLIPMIMVCGCLFVAAALIFFKVREKR